MNLIDFSKFIPFIKLKKDMNIPKDKISTLSANIVWESPREGEEVSIEKIKISKDNTLEYRNKKVLVYIRDQYSSYYNNNNEYKYHISYCRTLRQMKENKRYGRYVVSNRSDGIFLINLINNQGNIEKENINVKMRVCKNCLKKLNYKEYKSSNGNKQKNIYNNFSIDKFFKKYQSKIIHKPKYTSSTAPKNEYPEDWDEISKKYRGFKNWICEKCDEDYSTSRYKLHTHHIDGDKANNRYSNFRALCENCHKEEPYHEHMS